MKSKTTTAVMVQVLSSDLARLNTLLVWAPRGPSRPQWSQYSAGGVMLDAYIRCEGDVDQHSQHYTSNSHGHLEAVEVMAVLESDPETWGEFLALIHAYDDCVRTGQLRFKRMAPPPLRRSASLAGPAALRLHNASKSTSSDLSAQPRSSFSQQHLLYRLLQHQDPPSRSLDHHRHIQA
ncbi:hypothetical protein Hamer_G012275 [Homarus americanus]|uniref:Uncharacterized protein n=1 Tax=Homarus americanus TaxID=6706 RepID=A0A8J5KB17_HOMAM|nr:hypothetical protein Hamer_G012275 [Homarus americanus]